MDKAPSAWLGVDVRQHSQVQGLWELQPLPCCGYRLLFPQGPLEVRSLAQCIRSHRSSLRQHLLRQVGMHHGLQGCSLPVYLMLSCQVTDR